MSKDMWKIILKSQWVGNLPVMQSCWHMYTVPFEEKAVANTVFKFTWQDKTKQSLLNETSLISCYLTLQKRFDL